ncbi:MAG: signal peptidase I [Candidatus Hydrogenedentota bacterium]
MNTENLPDSPPPPESNYSRRAQEAKREILEFAKMVVWFLILFFALRYFVVEGYEVQGPSMEPSLVNNERILVLKLPHFLSQFRPFENLTSIDEGDVIVFESPNDPRKRFVKRVIAKGEGRRPTNVADAGEYGDSAVPVETVQVRVKDGDVYVDNRRVTEDYIEETARRGPNLHDEATLQPGNYYVLGDNRSVSKDSRSFGPIDDNRIIGQAVLRVWPPSRIGLIK